MYNNVIIPDLGTIEGLVAQRITRLTTDQKIPGSNPGKLGMFCIVKQKASTSVSCRGPLWAQRPPKMLGVGEGDFLSHWAYVFNNNKI